MRSITTLPTIYLHSGSTDIRKNLDSLSGLIRGTFGGNSAEGGFSCPGNHIFEEPHKYCC